MRFQISSKRRPDRKILQTGLSALQEDHFIRGIQGSMEIPMMNLHFSLYECILHHYHYRFVIGHFSCLGGFV